MERETRTCDVVVVGAGLSGLTTADRLRQHGVDVRVREAHSVVGGRVLSSAGGHDTGAEFIGQPHTALRNLIADLGLRTAPAGLSGGPILWRTGASRGSIRPPVGLRDLWRLTVALRRLRARALRLDADAPWISAGITELDSASLGVWLSRQGVTHGGLELADALIGGFATRSIFELSAAHAACWIGAANGLVAALRSGQQYVVEGGAHQIPRRLAERLADRIDTTSPVRSVQTYDGGVKVSGAKSIWHARAVVIAVPLPAFSRIEFVPALPAELRTAATELSYGTATKVTATAAVLPPVRHRSVVGGRPLSVAWRRGRSLAGIATREATADELVTDLARIFGVDRAELEDVAVTDWARRDYIGGSYLVYRPGEIRRLAPALRLPVDRRLRFAGSDFSRWPNSMEGAVRSGLDVADGLLPLSM
ncbi:NAD(P)/FAD-dependent oxidoreductase [Mycolicibacterium sp. XJ2]